MSTHSWLCSIQCTFSMMQRINPRHEFCPDDISLLNSAHLAQPTLLTSSRVTDLYLLALARHHGAKLATFDGRIPAEAVPDGRRHLAVIRT